MDKVINDHAHIPNINNLYKAEEVAVLLTISHSFAYQLMQTGQIPTVRLGCAC